MLHAAILVLAETMVILAPPDHLARWQGYAAFRHAAHPEVTNTVVSTAGIYAKYPTGSAGVRNPAESIHKYLRTCSPRPDYVLLGGAWIDAQNLNDDGSWRQNGTNVFFRTGEAMSLSNCVPGIVSQVSYTDANKITHTGAPSDLFYACLDIPSGQTYPWCIGTATGYFEQANISKCDYTADCAVTRVPLMPYVTTDGTTNSVDEIFTGFTNKIARAESAAYVGSGRLGIVWDSVSRSPLLDGSLPDEHEFYDDTLNLYDSHRATERYNDKEISQRQIVKDNISKYYPAKAVDTLGDHAWTKGYASAEEAAQAFYNTDHDYMNVDSHGWEFAAGWLTGARFEAATGLTLFLDLSVPCYSGQSDWCEDPHADDRLLSTPSLAEVAVLTPQGGAVSSVGNTRLGWANGNAGSYRLYHGATRAFLHYGYDAGNTWKQAHLDLAEKIRTGADGYDAFALAEHTLYGDPLVKIAPPTTSFTFASGENKLSGTNAYLKAEIPGDATLVASAGDSRLKILQTLTVGGDLTINDGIEGGVGGGVIMNGGTITINSTDRFYLGDAYHCSAITVNGDKTVIECDGFVTGVPTLTFNMASNAVCTLHSAHTNSFSSATTITVNGGTLRLDSTDLLGGAKVVLSDGARIQVGNDPCLGALTISKEPLNGNLSGEGALVYPYGGTTPTPTIASGSEIAVVQGLPKVGIDFPIASSSLGFNGNITWASEVVKGSPIAFTGGLPGSGDYVTETVSNVAVTAMKISNSAKPWSNKGSFISGEKSWSVFCIAKADTVNNGVIWESGDDLCSGYGGKGVALVRKADGQVTVDVAEYAVSPKTVLSAKMKNVNSDYHSYLVTYNTNSDGSSIPYMVLYIDGVKVSETFENPNFDTWSYWDGSEYDTADGYQLGSVYANNSTGLSAGIGTLIDDFAVWNGSVLTSDNAAMIAAAYPYCGIYEEPEPEPVRDEEPYIWYEFNGNTNASSSASITITWASPVYTTGATNGANTAISTTGGNRIAGTGADFCSGSWSMRTLARLDEAYPSGFAENDGICVAAFGQKGGSGFSLVKCGTTADPQVGVKRWGDGDKTLYLATSVPDCSTAFHDYVLTFDSGTLCLYIDGILMNSVAATLPSTNGSFQFGSMNNGLESTFWAGTFTIDDFRIYHRALDAYEVQELADGLTRIYWAGGMEWKASAGSPMSFTNAVGETVSYKTGNKVYVVDYTGNNNNMWLSSEADNAPIVLVRSLVNLQSHGDTKLALNGNTMELREGSVLNLWDAWNGDKFQNATVVVNEGCTLKEANSVKTLTVSGTVAIKGEGTISLTKPITFANATSTLTLTKGTSVSFNAFSGYYVISNVTEDVVTYSLRADAADVPTDVGGHEVAVPANWLADKYPSLSAAERAAKAAGKAANSRFTVAECYVLGLDPTDETAEFTVSIAFENGVPVISSSADGKVVSGWKVQQEGKAELSDDWAEVDTAKHHFFRATVIHE